MKRKDGRTYTGQWNLRDVWRRMRCGKSSTASVKDRWRNWLVAWWMPRYLARAKWTGWRNSSGAANDKEESDAKSDSGMRHKSVPDCYLYGRGSTHPAGQGR